MVYYQTQASAASVGTTVTATEKAATTAAASKISHTSESIQLDAVDSSVQQAAEAVFDKLEGVGAKRAGRCLAC